MVIVLIRIVESLTIIAITTVGLELVKELTELLKSDMEIKVIWR